jgi:hypothetical protein
MGVKRLKLSVSRSTVAVPSVGRVTERFGSFSQSTQPSRRYLYSTVASDRDDDTRREVAGLAL